MDSVAKNVIKIGGISGICCDLGGVSLFVGLYASQFCWKSLVLVAQLSRKGFRLFCLGSLVISDRLCHRHAVLK